MSRRTCIRYFQIRKTWDLGRYTSLSEADLIFRNQAKTRFAGQRFEHLYRGMEGRTSDGGAIFSRISAVTAVAPPFTLPLKSFA